MRNNVPELDGLRGLAILLVLATHTARFTEWTSAARIGWIGVDLFFVLSGFLITGILLESREHPHYFRNFYLRRALRIAPLYYAVIVFVFFIGPLLPEALQLAEYRFDPSVYRLPYYLFYLQNLLLHDLGPFPLAVTWSLAIEEHFYLLWPLAVRWCPRRRLPHFLAAILIGSPLFRWMAVHQYSATPFFIFTFTLCRLDGLAWGALLAVWLRSRSSGDPRFRWLHVPGSAAGTVVILRLWWGAEATDADKAAEMVWAYSLLALGFAAVMIWTYWNRGRAMTGLLRFPPLTYTGKISYGLYLLHPLVFSYCARYRLAWPWQYLLLFAAATFSWFAFEKHILGWKEKIAPRADQ